MPHSIDLRSDTVTRPTQDMRAAMAGAPVGDDLFRDDPTVLRLEALAAERLGKEVGLFVPSGTMGNQVSIMTHTTPGQEIIVGHACHIVHHELAAAARLSGVAYATAFSPTGPTAADVERLARPVDDPFSPTTGLVCMENALSDGRVVPLAQMRAVYDIAFARGLPVHLDGARIFNAALTLGCDAREIADTADTVMFCLAKGLCAPVGSVLVGPTGFIERARKNRKVLGGTMRQAGIIAAAGIIAIEEMTGRLAEDHENARLLARLLSAIPGIETHPDEVEINMVFWRTALPGFDAGAFVEFMAAQGILVLGEMDGAYRFMTHHDVSRADVEAAAGAVREYVTAIK